MDNWNARQHTLLTVAQAHQLQSDATYSLSSTRALQSTQSYIELIHTCFECLTDLQEERGAVHTQYVLHVASPVSFTTHMFPRLVPHSIVLRDSVC